MLVLKRPVSFYGVKNGKRNNDDQADAVNLSGQIEFGLHIAIKKEEIGGKIMWNAVLRRKQIATLVNFECKGYSRCEEIKDFLENQFAEKVIYQIAVEGTQDGEKRDPIEDYKSPMSARMLMGLLKYINDFAIRPTETLHVNINNEKQVIHLFFNCHAESIKDALSKDLPQGYFEVNLYQNLLDNLGIPDEIEIDIAELRNHNIRENGNQKGPLNMLMNAISSYENATYNVNGINGQMSFVKDPATLQKLDFRQLQKPEIRNVTGVRDDGLDQITVTQNVFLQLRDKQFGSDLVVIPIQSTFNFGAKTRNGIQLRYGWTQEIKFAYGNFSFQVKDCQYVQKQFKIQNYGQDQNDESRDLRLTDFQKTVCSNIEALNHQLNARYRHELEQSLSFRDDQGILGFLGQFNEWYPMPEKWMNEQALCSGVETREPLYWIDSNSLVGTFEINHKQFGSDDLCDNLGMRQQIDPRNLYFENDQERQKRVERRI